MTKNEISDVISNNIVKLLGDVVKNEISEDKSLEDVGADSIDRVDIMRMTLEDLNLKIPLVELGRAKNIGDLINILFQKMPEGNK